jgi:integration host factor subunit beta
MSTTTDELIQLVVKHQSHLPAKDVKKAVKLILEQIQFHLMNGDDIVIRGLGKFSFNTRPPRLGRNPNTGEAIGLAKKLVPHFKAGKMLKDKIIDAMAEQQRALDSAKTTEIL